MSCTIDKEKLTGYFDGELEAVERAEVEGHIAACSECLRTLDEIQGAAAAVKGLTRHAVPKGVTDGILRAIAAPEAIPMRPRRHAWLGWATSAAAALFVGLNIFYFSNLPKKEALPPQDSLVAVRREEAPKGPQPKKTEALTEEKKEKSNAVPKVESKADDAFEQDEEDNKNRFAGKDAEKKVPGERDEGRVQTLKDEPAEKPASAQAEPVHYTVVSDKVADARERVERELGNLGIARIETGAKELEKSDKKADAKDTCIEVELTDEQIAALEKRLNTDPKRMMIIPGVWGAEFAEELARLEKQQRGRATDPGTKGGEDRKKAEEPSKESADSGPQVGSNDATGGGGASKPEQSKRKGGGTKKRVVIYFHEFQKK